MLKIPRIQIDVSNHPQEQCGTVKTLVDHQTLRKNTASVYNCAYNLHNRTGFIQKKCLNMQEATLAIRLLLSSFFPRFCSFPFLSFKSLPFLFPLSFFLLSSLTCPCLFLSSSFPCRFLFLFSSFHCPSLFLSSCFL